MHIARITVKNFRCLADATLDCRRHVSLVGRNGAGKSTFLQALNIFFDRTAVVSDEDFYGQNRAEQISIEVRFEGLRTQERTELAAYLDDDAFTVTKRFDSGALGQTVGGRYFATERHFEPFQAIRLSNEAADEKTALYNKLVEDGVLPPGTSTQKSFKRVEAAMSDFEAANPLRLIPIERETQLFGDKNVGTGKIEKFTRFVYVPAVRDVADETTDRKAAFAQLMDLVVMQKVVARKEVRELPDRIRQAVTEAYGEDVVRDDLDALAKDLNEALEPFVQNAKLSFRLIPPDIKDPGPRVQPRVSEDSYAGDLSRKGHGLQRAVLFTVLQHFARVRNAPPPGEEAYRPDLILAIEEPELYQHPSQCRNIATVLHDLSEITDDSPAGTQVLFSTHSPFFLSMERFEDIAIVRKITGDEGKPAKSSICARTLEDIRKRWAKCCALPDEKVTLDTLLARVTRPFLVGASEGFFADGVLLVEGPGDAALLRRLAERMGVSFDSLGISVVPVDGKANLGAPLLVFESFEIPTFVVFDADAQNMGRAAEKDSVRENAFLQRAFGISAVSKFPNEQVTARFACFEENVEQHCRHAIGQEQFDEISAEVAARIGIKEAKDALKNGTGAALFIDSVYARGQKLPAIEQIIQAAALITKTHATTDSVTP
jgi:predicted ATP-dependent endonuclease of OLD family